MQPWEQSWLEYCRRILDDTVHGTACTELGGSAPDRPEIAADLRWPGYCGPGYEPGGLLWINIVHADLGQRGCEDTAAALVDVTRRWRDRRASDAEYLQGTRTAYGVGLRRWTVGQLIRHIAVEGLSVPIEDLGYVNAARCQVIPGTDQHRSQDAIVGLCQSWLPVAAAAEALQPSLVVTTSATVLRLDAIGPGPLVVGHHQRRPLGLLKKSPWHPRPDDPRPWLESLADDWQRHRQHLRTA